MSDSIVVISKSAFVNGHIILGILAALPVLTPTTFYNIGKPFYI